MATILVVDDVPSNRESLVTLLGSGGHQLLEAPDGVEALALTREARPDLIIADILLPTMDGFEFVRQLRDDPAIGATPVAFYTEHYLEREARDLAAQCGVHHLLTKPADPEVILRTVAAALGEAKHLAPPPPEPDHEPLQLVCDTLSRKIEELEIANRRQTALVEASEQLASERDPLRLLEGVVRSARAVVGARHAILAVRRHGSEQWQHCVASGIPTAVAASLPAVPSEGLLGRLLADEVVVIRAGAELVGLETGLPASYPPFTALLAVRVSSLQRTYGWLCLTDKLGAGNFSAADTRHALTIASLAGRVYENGSLYQEVKSAADALTALNAELERRVEERTAQLDAAMRELETFSYSASHDLRAPLRRIEGLSTLMCEDYAAHLAPEGLRHLDGIRVSAERMSHLIDDLLSLARLSRHQMSRIPVSLSALAAAVAGDLQSGAPTRHVTLRVAPDLTAVGDPHLLRIALDNLLGNAWKYSSKQPQATIEFGAEEREHETVYFVRDNGAGFDPAHVGRLFLPFQRLHSEAEFEGSGIGLATVQRIIARHGGRVWAEGRPNQGATFYFTLGRGAHGGAESER